MSLRRLPPPYGASLKLLGDGREAGPTVSMFGLLGAGERVFRPEGERVRLAGGGERARVVDGSVS